MFISSHSKISDIKIHPLFKQIAATYDFDLSLIRLERKVDITPSCLPPQMPKPGAFCRISGWGKFDRYSHTSRKLKTANVHIVDQDLCQRIFPFQVSLTFRKHFIFIKRQKKIFIDEI